MMAFVGDSNKTVNHKDENKLNNKLDNLEYMTIADNLRYSKASKITATNIETGEKKNYNSIREAVVDGFYSSSICNCLHGKRKTHKGYTFTYIK